MPKKRKRRYQLSIRALLILVLFGAIGFWWHGRYYEQHKAATELAAYGGKLSFHSSVADALPFGLNRFFRDVESVDLSRHNVQKSELQLLLKFPRLRRLYLARCSLMDEDLLIVGKCRRLERLAIWGNENVLSRDMQHLTSLQSLRVLDITKTRVDDRSLVHLSQLPNLEDLRFDFRRFHDAGLKCLAKMKRMKVGEMQCDGITDAGLHALSQMDPTMYSIVSIKDSAISDEGLLSLACDDGMLPVGPDFQLQKCPVSNRILSAMPWSRLKDVRFVDTQIDFDAVVEKLGPSMKTLTLFTDLVAIAEGWDWQATTSRGWLPKGTSVCVTQDVAKLSQEQLAKLPNLTGVYLGSRKPAGDVLEYLVSDKITYFEMSDVPANTPVVQQVSKWKNLEYAILNFCNPRTVMRLQPLESLQKLKSISLYCAPIDDDMLKTLAKLPQLEEISVSHRAGNSCTSTGISQLQKNRSLRSLEIINDGDWNPLFDELMKLQHVRQVHLRRVKLTPQHSKEINERRGWRHLVR